MKTRSLEPPLIHLGDHHIRILLYLYIPRYAIWGVDKPVGARTKYFVLFLIVVPTQEAFHSELIPEIYIRSEGDTLQQFN